MKTYEEVQSYPVDPADFWLICGHLLPNRVGKRAFNYYDMKWCEVRPGPHRPEVDTSGRLPHGITYWFSEVDGSRACCETCVKWLYPDHAV